MGNYAINPNSFSGTQRRSPSALGAAVAVHIGAAIVVMLMPGVEIIERIKEGPLIIKDIPMPDPPPVDAQVDRKPLRKTPATAPDPVVPLKSDSEFTTEKTDYVLPTNSGGTAITGGGTIIDPPSPLPNPVWTQAKIDQRYMRDFQPPYPPGKLRLDEQASFTVRVTVGADGRVKDIVLVSPVDDAFWDATRKQALRKWRFTPATRDGVAVDSVREMAVHFRIDD